MVNQNQQLPNMLYLPVKMKNTKDNPALHDAIMASDLNRCNLLIEQGIDINAKSEDGITPLCLAAAKNQTDLCNSLLDLDKGVDVSASVDMFGNTPLLHAVKYSNLELIERFVNAGDNVNALNAAGATPLNAASCKCHDLDTFMNDRYNRELKPKLDDNLKTHLKIIKILLDAGARPTREMTRRIKTKVEKIYNDKELVLGEAL